MTEAITIEGVTITPKLLESTMEVSLRGIAYRKLLKAMAESGDETLRSLADDGSTAWNFIFVASAAVKTDWDVIKISAKDTGETLLKRFKKWLEAPAKLTSALVKAVDELEPVIDPVTAPKDAVTDPND